MSEHIIYNKRKICYTEVSDFTDFQGIGSDPLYKRYESVQAVLRTCIAAPYQSFLSEPMYNSEEDTIDWFVEKWDEAPVRLVDLTGEARERYRKIMDDTVRCYRNAALNLVDEDLIILGGAMKYVSEDKIFCYDNKVVMVCWGMRYDTNKYHDIGNLIHSLPAGATPQVYCQVIFNPGEQGDLEGKGILNVPVGSTITVDMIPAIKAHANHTFTSWDKNPFNHVVSGDVTFTAQYEPTKMPPAYHNVLFQTDGNGILNGTTRFSLPEGTVITDNIVPKVSPKKGFKFKGWDVNPQNFTVSNDAVFTAQYEKKKGWFATIWPWLWKILLFLLLLLLLFLLLRNCKDRKHDSDNNNKVIGQDSVASGKVDFDPYDSVWMQTDPRTGKGGIYNPGDPYTPTPTPPEYGDILPPQQGVLPPIGDDAPIRRNPEPGYPVIIENKLNVLLENDDKTIMQLARAFKNKYPSDQYKVVYYDDVVKRMQIEVPVSERAAMKERLPGEFAPEYKLFVFDESMFESFYRPSDPEVSNTSHSWYLTAIHAFEAWDISTGSSDVVVAIVDNGFTLTHPELSSKVVMPYNVWTHDTKIFSQSVDHGTHVAGTAIALANNGSGLCGIAPNCMFMPIQVADRIGRMTNTSILDGILYALYQGADVVNVSLGMELPGMSQVPERQQQQLIDYQFKEEERLWREVSRIADLHKATIVVAAGNDNVLAGIDALHRPENIIVVSAVNKQNQNLGKADFSNYGADYSTVSAPGVDIYSCYGSSYRSMDGTSMAAPIVSGAVALMKSLNKSLTTQQIVCILQSSGKAVGDKIGPMLVLDKALQKVKENDIYDCTPEAPQPARGDVEVTLQWENYNDLDLYCQEPSSEILYHGHKNSQSGGVYQFDMNAGGNKTNTPMEHVYWPSGVAPSGTYSVWVHYYRQKDSQDETPFTVRIKYGNQVEIKTGTLSTSNKDGQHFTFTFGNNDSR